MRRWGFLVLLCGCGALPTTLPQPVELVPNYATASVRAPVRILGRSFMAHTTAEFGGDGALTVDTRFHASLGSTALEDVQYVGPTELAAVVPRTLVPGIYDLSVTAPNGRRGTLVQAFEVVAPTCLTDDDGDGHLARTCGGDDCDDTPAPMGCGALCHPDIDTDVCDGYDNDCDGETDDGYVVDAGCGTGDCLANNTPSSCVDGLETSCVPNVPQSEGPNGDASCADGQDNDCDGTTDLLDVGCAVGLSHPPVAALVVDPPAGTVGVTGTGFAADASSSTDDVDVLATLGFAFDWGDGGGFGASAQGVATAGHSYATAGEYLVTVRVRDSDALTAYASYLVVVRQEGTVLATPVDEAGLIAALDAAQLSAGRDTIVVPRGSTIGLAGLLQIQTDADGVDLIGDGAVIDGSGIGSSSACLSLDGSNIRILGFEITACPSFAVVFNSGAGHEVSRCTIHDNGNSVSIGSSALDPIFGPGNEVTGHAASGVQINAPCRVVDNRIHGNGAHGVNFSSNDIIGAVVQGNTVFGNGGDGIFLTVKTSGAKLYHNTISDNAGNGINLGNLVELTEIVGNAITDHAAGWGVIYGADAKVARFDHNAFYANVSGDHWVTTNPSFTVGDVASDPLYLDRAAGDYRLASGSDLIDAGDPALGVDCNGVVAGDYNGGAPDIGAWESP
ncbi:MAG: right-handed parallel beta-helix repeat-containing protein [Myxococcota bacterium]